MTPAGDHKLTAGLASRLREAGPDSRLAVIVEVAAPALTVRFESRERGAGSSLRPTAVDVDAEAGAAKDFELAVDYFQSRCWDGPAPVFIAAASAIALQVNPAELQDIVAQSFVRQISLNEPHPLPP